MAANKKGGLSKNAKIGILIAGAGVGAYAIKELMTGGKAPLLQLPAVTTPSVTAPKVTFTAPKITTSSTSGWTEGTFPLKLGAKNNYKVQRLQQAIIKLGGAPAQAVIKTGGADGFFGNGTSEALRLSLANGQEVSENTYNGFLAKAGMSPAAATVAATSTTVSEMDVDTVYKQLSSFLTDEMVIFNIFAGKSDAYLKAFQAAYNKKYGTNRLVTMLRTDVGGDFQTLVANLERIGLSGLGSFHHHNTSTLLF